jgi:hypothetical protein
MPSVGEVSTAHADLITRALLGVREGERGIRWSVDSLRKGKPTILWGLPSDAEVAAMEGLRGKMPDTIVDNMVTIMKSLQAASGDRPVLQGRYVRIQSHRTSATTEGRKLISKDFQFVADETFVPLHAESTTRYWSTDGSTVLSQAQYEALRPAEQAQYVPREGYTINVFNLGKFNENLSKARSEGLRIYDKDGNVTGYVKDLAGQEITAKRFNELFFDDAEFHTLANHWMQRYLEGGPIDPTSVEIPGGKITEPSAAMLGNGDLTLGEARLTALRATFGMTVRNGRIVVNPTNFTNQINRGMNFPFHSMDPTFLGPVQDTGATTKMAQPVVTRGQFNMSPGAWDKLSQERIATMRGKGNLTNAWTHPALPNSHIREYAGRTYEIFVEGQEIPNTAKSFDEAVAQSNQVRLKAEGELDAARYAEKVLRDEAKWRAAQEAKDVKLAKDQKAAEEKTARARTVAEEKLLKEVSAGNKSWLTLIEDVSRKEALVERQYAEQKARNDNAQALRETENVLRQLQEERDKINADLKADILRRNAERNQAGKDAQAETNRTLREQEAADKARAAELRKDIQMRNQEASKKAREQARVNQQILETLQRDYEAQQRRIEAARKKNDEKAARDAERAAKEIAQKAEKLKEETAEIVRKDLEVKAEDAAALADALNSKEPELDLAKVINDNLRVSAGGLPVAVVNSPLIVRRIGGGKPFVPRSASVVPQAGPAVDATTGNTRAAAILGSPEVAEASGQVRQYFGRTMGLSIDLQNAINSVWKTELGNQLVAYYNGLDKKGKPVYTYHIYGINGAEIYRSQDAIGAYNALRINEDRLRNPTKNVPDKFVSKRAVKAEFYKSMPGGGSVLEQSTTKVGREIQERAAQRYK